ncbi:hypothetical protein [Nocardia mikamii]|uniref:hypothetical protein n=1 Tax=Nocardia mikamii TaxID=508464 RepID=UPI0012F4D108|nr:hypothetical protein [Nocardia mikamii]
MSATTLVLLFQPWLSASGPGGAIRSDAFGRLAGTESQQDWGGAGLHNTDISGTWAVLTCVAILATIFAAAAYLRTRAAIFSTAAAVAGSGVALFVLADVLYLDNKESELRAAVADDSSFSGILRGLFGGAHAAHQLAGAHLDIAAMLAGITAFGAAACLLTNHLRDNPVARTVARPMTTFAAAAPSSMPAAPAHAPTARSAARYAQPSAATAQPLAPVAQPLAPVAQPLAPVAQPLVPVAQPLAATAQSSAPIAQPLAAAAQSSAPVARPSAPVARPSVPVAQPLVPVAQPPASTPLSAAPAAQPHVPTAPHPAPVVALADITAEHEPAPRASGAPRFPARKQPSWRIVIPAGEVSAHAPARVERTFAK